MADLPGWFWVLFFWAEELAIVVAIVSILRQPREARAMWAWIIALLAMPLVGLVLYMMFGPPRRGRITVKRRRRLRRLGRGRRAGPKTGELASKAEAQPLNDTFRAVAMLAERVGGFTQTPDNDVKIFHDADATFRAIREAIEAAQHHVHMEYYIFQDDETGRAFQRLLIEKAKSGVECRLLLDFVGCWRLPRRFVRRLREAGVQVAYALPVVPWRGRWRANYRNHRKLVVVDGRIGLTGSQNIGDEYRGRLAKRAPWRDTHMQIVGPDVHHLQEVFVQDWFFRTQEDLAKDEYFPPCESQGQHCIQTVPSGPDREHHVMHQLLFAAVSMARESICIVTPYFVPDIVMLMALQAAAYRGVRVRIIVPTRTDHRVALWAGRSCYPDLLMAGVEIYEHDHTMLHSKVMVIDQTWAMVGSANMDERSFAINFELTMLLYDVGLADELYHDFSSILSRSRRVRPVPKDERPFLQSIKLGLSRLASPLL